MVVLRMTDDMRIELQNAVRGEDWDASYIEELCDTLDAIPTDAPIANDMGLLNADGDVFAGWDQLEDTDAFMDHPWMLAEFFGLTGKYR